MLRGRTLLGVSVPPSGLVLPFLALCLPPISLPLPLPDAQPFSDRGAALMCGVGQGIVVIEIFIF